MTEQSFRAESPFVDDASPAQTRESGVFGVGQGESPFLNEYQLEDELGETEPLAEAVSELFAELYDEEFEEAALDVASELNELAPSLFAGESVEPREEARAASVMRQALEPIAEATDAYFGEVEARLNTLDPRSLSAERLAEILDEIEPEAEFASPAFEQLFGGVLKKLKKVASGAVALAKKGALALASPLLKPLLNKLRGFVRPLLDKVLKFALNKIPAQYRGLATQLANKLQGKVAGAVKAAVTGDTARPDAAPAADPAASSADATAGLEPASADADTLQQSVDQELLELLLTPNHEFLTEAPEQTETAWDDHPSLAVEQARARFVRELTQHIQQGESPAPAIENFLPALTLALKAGIKLIGRQKVVSFLGGLLAKLIGPLIGKQAAPALGNLIADTGLRALLQVELSEEERESTVAHAIAGTVEETTRALGNLPDYVLDTPELLELSVREAFDNAAAANFPAEIVQPELREAEGGGSWVMLPLRGRKLYKKFSRVFDVAISPRLAVSIPSFGGGSVAGFLRDCLRVQAKGPLSARVHLYEAIPNTRIHHIARLERARGLGPGSRKASVFHPLTRHAAAALLNAPGLGRETPSDADPLKPTLGQRLYYLEIPNAPVRPLGKRSHLHLTANFPKQSLNICLYLSETLAQKTAEALRKGTAPTIIARELRSALAANSHTLTSDDPGKHVRLIFGARGAGSQAGSARYIQRSVRAAVRRILAQTALNWLWLRLTQYLQINAAAFIAATEGPEDGVRLCLKFEGVSALSGLHAALVKGGAAPASNWSAEPPAAAKLTISAGPKHG